MGRLVKARLTGIAAYAAGEDENYVTRVAKYVPAEIVAGYVAVQNILQLESGACSAPKPLAISGWWYAVYFVFLALTPAYLYSQRTKGEPYVLQIVIGAIAFIVWSYALTACPKFSIYYGMYQPQAAAVVLIMFSLVSGLIVPKK